MQMYIIELLLFCFAFFILYKILTRKNLYIQLMKCIKLVRRGRCSKATSNLEELMKAVAEGAPDNEIKIYEPLIQISLGKCYLQKFNTVQDYQILQKSIDLLESSINDIPKVKYADIYFNGLIDLGTAYYQRSLNIDTAKNLYKSIYYLNESLKLTPKSDMKNVTIINYQLGLCYLKLSDLSNKKENLKLSFERFSDVFNIRSFKNSLFYYINNASMKAGSVLIKLADIEEHDKNIGLAAEYLKKAEAFYMKKLKRVVNNKGSAIYPLILSNLGYCYFELAKTIDTAANLEMAENLLIEAAGFTNEKKFLSLQKEIANNLTEICLLMGQPERYSPNKSAEGNNYLSKLKQLVESGKVREEARFYSNQGDVLFLAGNYQKAEECYSKSLKIAGDNEKPYGKSYFNACYRIGCCLNELGQFEKALEYLEMAENISPDNKKIYLIKGNSLLELEKYHKAIDSYDKALELDDKYAEALNQKGNTLFCLVGIEGLGRLEEAIICYKNAIRYLPGMIYSYIGAAQALGKLGRFEEALNYYNQAIEINPGRADIYCDKAEMLFEIGYSEAGDVSSGRFREALQCCSRAVELEPDLLYARYIKGNVFKKMERYREAIEEYSKVLQHWPENKECRNEIAHTYFMLGDFENALYHCNLIIGQDPENIGAYIGKGSILDCLGKKQEALKSYFRVLELKPDYTGVYGNIIRAFLKLGKTEEAMKFINTALNVVPDYFELYFHKGYVHFYIDEIEMAMECFEKAIELNPDYADSYIGKASILIAQGEYKSAIEFADIAIRLDPENRYAYYIKGQALDFMEEHEKARECYKKAGEIR